VRAAIQFAANRAISPLKSDSRRALMAADRGASSVPRGARQLAQRDAMQNAAEDPPARLDPRQRNRGIGLLRSGGGLRRMRSSGAARSETLLSP
jgi:hypothetical protein